MPYDPNRHHRRSIRLRGYDYALPGAYFITICTHGRAALFGVIDGGVMRLNDAGRMVERWWCELPVKFPTVITDAFVVMPDHIHGIVMIGAGVAGDDTMAGGYINPPLRNDVVDRNVDINAPNAIPSVGADLHIRPRRIPNESPATDDIRPRRIPNESPATDDIHPRDVDETIVPANVTAMGGDMPTVSVSKIVQWFKIMTTTEYIRHVKESVWPPFQGRIWQRNYYERIVRDDRALASIRRYIAENPARWEPNPARLDALLARMDVKG